MELPWVVLLAFITGRVSLYFTEDTLAVLWPTNGIFIAYFLQHPSARTRPLALAALYLTTFASMSLTGHFTTIFPILSPLPNVVSQPTCAYVVETLIKRFGGVGRRGRDDHKRNVIDLHDVRHMVLLMCGLPVGGLISASLSRFFFPLAMTNKMYALWLCSDYIGDLLVVPFMLLADELPSVLRQWHAVWAYAVLIAINLLYVVLRILKAGDTQLGLYLAFPWLLLMTHLFGAAGTYTGCLLTGFISAFTAAMMDDIQRNFYVHGHIFILFGTCVCFINIFHQRDEALNHVEHIVDERTAQLKKTMHRLSAAENKTLAALESRTRFLTYLCHELRNPLHQIINLAEVAREMPPEKVKSVLGSILNASMYMSNFINDVLDLREAEVSGAIPPNRLSNDETEVGSSVDQAFACLVAFSQEANPPILVERRVDPEVEHSTLALSEKEYSKMIRRLISYARAASPNPHVYVSFTASAGDRTVCIQTSHPGSVTTEDDLLELVMPFSTRAKASWVPEYEGSGLSLSIVREIVQSCGGHLHLKSLVDENCVVIKILLPLDGMPLIAPGDPLQVGIVSSLPSAAVNLHNGLRYRGPIGVAVDKGRSTDRHPYSDDVPDGFCNSTEISSVSSPSTSSNFSTPSTPSTPSICSTPSTPSMSPIPSIPPTPTSPSPAPPSVSAPLPASATILVVDDSVINRKILTRLFSLLHFKTIEAENGQDALRKYLRSDPADIVLITMDINMPVMDGFEASRILRTLGCEAPIVAVTANLIVDDEQKEKYYGAGITEIAPKPFMKADAQGILKRYSIE
ncbi:hypothetical protein HK102_003446 [Quaeritorhiza haematococci]|nr:hypothetical protein HK102_003446 [Quaeritorhiza haematococci]